MVHIDKHITLPLLVYGAVVYALLATKPECMFDKGSGMPKNFGTGPGESLLPFWMAALLAGFMSTHFMMPPPGPPRLD